MVLKPGAYAAIEIAKHLGERLTVSEDSVLDSGTRQIVFLSKGDGHFEPRQVTVGERAGGRRILLSGLRAGDVIVSSGNFLVDSESRLKSAMQGMSSGGKTKQPAPPAGTSSHAGHGS
jgi:multidrug efflux pump subunit AcrA (membrane-fusion protein)